jgi:hypothetical protein
MKHFLKAGLLLCIVAAPAVAHAAGKPVTGLTPGRISSLVGAAAGLTGVISGALALRAFVRLRAKKRGAVVAQVGGLTAIVLSIVHLARATGAFGTGSGKLGAIIAIVLGVTAMVLGRMAMVRYRKLFRESGTGS